MSDPNVPPSGGDQTPTPPPPGSGQPPPAAPPPNSPPPQGGSSAPPPGQGGYTSPPAQPYQPGMQQAMGPGGTVLAEGWKRIVALLLDWIVLYVVVALPLSVIIGGGFTVTSFGESLVRSLIAGVLTYIVYLLYFALLIGTRGQTLFGMVFSIKVVGTDGSPATMEQGFKRSAWVLLGLIPCLGAIAALGLVIWGLVNLFNDPARQVPWDKLADTVVVDA